MKKREELGRPDSCLSKAKLDEPLFVLRANDPLAPVVVSYWAKLAQESGLHEYRKVESARGIAVEMQEYRLDQLRNKA